jgi:hypothetical protein
VPAQPAQCGGGRGRSRSLILATCPGSAAAPEVRATAGRRVRGALTPSELLAKRVDVPQRGGAARGVNRSDDAGRGHSSSWAGATSRAAAAPRGWARGRSWPGTPLRWPRVRSRPAPHLRGHAHRWGGYTARRPPLARSRYGGRGGAICDTRGMPGRCTGAALTVAPVPQSQPPPIDEPPTCMATGDLEVVDLRSRAEHRPIWLVNRLPPSGWLSRGSSRRPVF